LPSLPLWLNVIVFLVAGAAIWWSGTRLERHANEIAEQTGMGQAFTGTLLLAAATSLPELATTITAIVVLNDVTLAVNSLLGGVALQTALIGLADGLKRKRGALTSFNPEFPLLIQSVGLVLFICIVIAGITAEGKPVVLDVSAWLILLLLAYVAIMRLTYVHRNRPRWRPADTASGQEEETDSERGRQSSPNQHRSKARLWMRFGMLSALVLAAGWFATHVAETIAKESGLGSAFVGATLLALATSLPELTTTILAARRRHYSMAISNIFGSNAFDLTLLVLADVLFRDGTILERAEVSAVFVALIGAVMTCVYILGMLERADKTILGMGWDSLIALLVYGAGMAVLYTMT
jgi:cation:H+ antiporter